jgi:hypothetical protein
MFISTVETVSCLAQWKEGSSRYFLGLVSYQHHASYEERFRCFVYERSKHGSGGNGEFGHLHGSHSSTKFHTHSHRNNGSDGVIPTIDQIYRVAQSGDASCNGLSSMEGSRTMNLKKGKDKIVLSENSFL